MRSKLELRFSADDDGSGKLIASVKHGAFAGTADAWFEQRDLRRFGIDLRDTFPIPSGAVLEVCGGFLGEPHVALRVAQVDATGTVVIRVHLATPNEAYPKLDQRCTLSVPMSVEYQALSDFGAALVELIDGKQERAELLGSAN